MNNRFSTSPWVAVVVATIAFTLLGSAAYAKPKITYTVQKTIEIKQSGNGWNRPTQQYIPIDPHTKAVQKPAAAMKKGEYQINIV
ncbi:MAG: hypothetical protein K2X93_04575, partial [Candidatus Obscuribacterales bacterium]|nr:hypothetical protein [Candidatus Obscuribacterales bacterium]